MDKTTVALLIAEMDALFAERARHFPRRDPVNTAALNDAYGRLFTLLWSDAPPPEPAAPCLDDRFLNVPIFLCGYLKSGTTLLTALLDAHPALVVLPGDTNLLHLLRRFTPLPRPQLDEAWGAHWLKRLVNPTGQPPFWLLGQDGRAYADFLGWLRRELAAWDGENRAALLVTAVRAYYCANRERP
ncbi:MAG: sulfotransferase, partial [Anaerolineae bacterium]